MSALVGIFAGGAAIVFQVLTESVGHFFLEHVSGFRATGADGEYRLFESQSGRTSLTAVVGVLILDGLYVIVLKCQQTVCDVGE